MALWSRRVLASCRPWTRSYCQLATETPEQMSELLKKFVRDKIRVDGPISVHDFMKLASSSAAGYYNKSDRIFGSSGDFVTSPELSQVFGELVGVWVYNELWNSGERGDWQLVELGPGSGQLMEDVVRTLNVLKVGKVDIVHGRAFKSSVWSSSSPTSGPQNMLTSARTLQSERLAIHLVEVSDALVDQQELRLCGKVSKNLTDEDVVRRNKTRSGIPVVWHRSMDTVPQQFSVFIANEFLDALPVHFFEREDDQWKELNICLDQGSRLQFSLSKGENIHTKGLIPEWIRKSDKVKWEVCPDAGRTVTDVALRITQHGGFGLFVDYGHGGERTTRSLRTYYKHSVVNVLDMPGMADITADVDFGYLSRILQDMCLVFGPVRQRDFLAQMGIKLRLERLLQQSRDENVKAHLLQSYKMLVDGSEDGMGTRFKAFSMFPSTLKNILQMRGGYPAGFFPTPDEDDENVELEVKE